MHYISMPTRSNKSMHLKTFRASIALLSLLGVTLVPPIPTQAREIPISRCPTSGTLSEATFKSTIDGSSAAKAACYTAATSYQILLYEVGLCSSNPISGGFSRSTCTVIYSNPTPSSYLEIAGTTKDLSSGYTNPTDTSKKDYAYMIVGETLKGNGSYSTTTRSYYPGTGLYFPDVPGAGFASTETAPGSTMSYSIATSTQSTCTDSVTLGSYSISYANLTNTDTLSTLSGSRCTGTTKVAISTSLATPLASTDKVHVKFDVTSYGIMVQSHNTSIPDKAVPGFLMGIPLVVITPQ